MIEYADDQMPYDDQFYYQRSRTWNFVEPDIKDCTQVEPLLVRANPGDWPPVYLPAVWPEERRAQWMARWKELNG